MPQFDSDLTILSRLVALEEQKHIESEALLEKRAFPLKTLEGILNEKRKKIERDSYSKSVPLGKFYDKEMIAFLEPVFTMLKNIQDRLDDLEKK
jgi:hypothetical protein